MSKKAKVAIISLSVLVFVLATALVVMATPLRTALFNPKSAPSIKLQLADKPMYSVQDDLYLFLVEAIVSGNPEPDVLFSRDDSHGSMGPNQIAVYLMEGEKYTLLATAENQVGKGSDSLELLAVSETTGETATPADPDSSTSETEPADPDDQEPSSPVEPGPDAPPETETEPEPAPGNEGDSVIVIPDFGDIFPDWDWGTLNLPVILKPIFAETGFVELGHKMHVSSNYASCVFTGINDVGEVSRVCRGLVSFNIESLEGIQVESVRLELGEPEVWGDIDMMFRLTVTPLSWGPKAPELDTYDNVIGNSFVYHYFNPPGEPELDEQSFKELLQELIDAGEPRIQFGLHLFRDMAFRGQWHGLEYGQENIRLVISRKQPD